jgi:hypothetical protein
MANYYTMKNEVLIEYADQLGILDPEDMERQDLIEAIKAKEAESDNVAVEKSKAKSDMVDIFIYNQEGPNGQDAVFVSVLAKPWLIPREQWVTVPRAVYNVLENAKETHAEYINGEWHEREVKRYAYDHRPSK